MSEQLTARVDVDLAEGPVLSRRSPIRWVMLVVGLAIALALPWFVYPPVAMDVAAWGLFAAFYLVTAAALLPAADSFKSARPFCRALAARVPSGEPVATYRFWQWRAEYTFYGDRAFASLQTPEQLRDWRGRWVLVEDWALPEARSVLGDAPTALTGRVGRGTIVLLGPLH